MNGSTFASPARSHSAPKSSESSRPLREVDLLWQQINRVVRGVAEEIREKLTDRPAKIDRPARTSEISLSRAALRLPCWETACPFNQ